MNIFCLDATPGQAAIYHCNKHVVKQILESCQLLSTAHRILDGTEELAKSKTGRNKKIWRLNDFDDLYYSATHVNHPSAIWCRQSDQNYLWLQELTVALCKEYTYRYGKIHKCEATRLVYELARLPKKIPIGRFTQPTPAMPDEYKVVGDSVQSYRNYYNGSKSRMFAWKNRPTPSWINDAQ